MYDGSCRTRDDEDERTKEKIGEEKTGKRENNNDKKWAGDKTTENKERTN